jgi:hypothetical protein
MRRYLLALTGSALPATCCRSALESNPAPVLQQAIIQRRAIAATRQDQHSGRNQLMADMTSRIGVPVASRDPSSLSQDVIPRRPSHAAHRSTPLGPVSLRHIGPPCHAARCRAVGLS